MVSVTLVPLLLVPAQAAHPDYLCTPPGHSILASHHLLQRWDSLQLSRQQCGGVPGVHHHLELLLTPIARVSITTGSNWVQGHTPGPNNSNSHPRFHQHLQCNNRSVNNQQVWSHHHPIFCPQQHTRIHQTMLAVMALQ